MNGLKRGASLQGAGMAVMAVRRGRRRDGAGGEPAAAVEERPTVDPKVS